MKCIIVVSLFIMGTVWCQQDILDQLPAIPEININDLESAALENYAKDALVLLKDKCSNVSGGNEVYEQLQTRTKELQTFITNNINFTALMSELEEAKKTGSMDEVFAKYCAKKPEAMSRFKNITETFKQCVGPEDQKSIDAKLNLTEKMVHFLCEKDGDKIAMFIANGGEECLSSKFQGLQGCFNKSSDSLPSANWQSLNLVDIDEKICEEFPALEKCVVNVLEECKIKTPANIMGALFRYLRKNMECLPQKEAVVADFLNSNRLKRATDVGSRLQRKCEINTGGPVAYTNLEESFHNFLQAFHDNILTKTEECLILKRNTDFQLGTFLLNLKICLTPSEDFLPTYIRSIVEGIFDYLCEDQGKKLAEFKKSTGLQCLSRRNITTFADCTRPSYSHTSDSGQLMFKQEEFCRDVDKIEECTSQHLIRPCSQDPRFKQISEDVLKLTSEKCSGCSIYVNVLLICGLVLYQIQKCFS